MSLDVINAHENLTVKREHAGNQHGCFSDGQPRRRSRQILPVTRQANIAHRPAIWVAEGKTGPAAFASRGNILLRRGREICGSHQAMKESSVPRRARSSAGGFIATPTLFPSSASTVSTQSI